MSLLRPTPRVRGAARRRPRALRLVVAVLAVTTALAGCGIRLETPAPTAPAPDATEIVRSRSVDDALELAAGARAAGTAANAVVLAVLAQVADFSDQHAVELGGVYDSGLATPTPGTPTPTAGSTSAPDPGQVLALLATADRTAAADAGVVADGELARLLASIAASRARLVAHLAAKLDDPSRSAARTTAVTHRARAESWAQAWGLDGTTSDPRRATYALPAGLDDPATALALALAQSLEVGLTATYASVVADTAPGSRPEVIAALLTADADAAAWGAPATAFPGLPER